MRGGGWEQDWAWDHSSSGCSCRCGKAAWRLGRRTCAFRRTCVIHACPPTAPAVCGLEPHGAAAHPHPAARHAWRPHRRQGRCAARAHPRSSCSSSRDTSLAAAHRPEDPLPCTVSVLCCHVASGTPPPRSLARTCRMCCMSRSARPPHPAAAAAAAAAAAMPAARRRTSSSSSSSSSCWRGCAMRRRGTRCSSRTRVRGSCTAATPPPW